MEKFSRVAFYETLWRAGLGTIAGLVLMLLYSAQPAAALLIGAHVALLFTLGMIVHSRQLTEEKLVRSDVWLALEPADRPPGEPGRHWAREHFAAMMLRFAKGSVAIAVALAGLSLLLRA